MSKLINTGTLIGIVTGAVSAGLAVWQFASAPINDTDDLIAVLNDIHAAIERGAVDVADEDTRAEIVAAVRPVTALLSRNLNALDPAAVAELTGVQDARPGETVEFFLDDGRIVPVTAVSWNNFPPDLLASYDGERYPVRPGWQQPIEGTGCRIIYTGPTREEPPLIRFRLSC